MPETQHPSRNELLRARFRFQSVSPDKSNTTAQNIRDVSEEQGNEDRDDRESDDDSVIVVKKELGGNVKWVEKKLLSTWRRPSPKEECSICFESYLPGEEICVGKTNKCNHVFHYECIHCWFQDHDVCPLCCRTDLMKVNPKKRSRGNAGRVRRNQS